MGYICTFVLPLPLYHKKGLSDVKTYPEWQRATRNSTLPPDCAAPAEPRSALQRQIPISNAHTAPFPQRPRQPPHD